MQQEKKTSLLSPTLKWFLFAMIMANIAGRMFPMFLPIYLTELGASITQVGMVFTVTSVVILVLQILGGWISDSIGRLKAIAIGSVGGILGFIAMLLAPSWQWMLIAMAAGQLPYALVGPSFGAFIAENSSKENRGRVYGITDTIYQITGVIGPPLGGFLVGQYGFKMMLLVSTILYVIAAGLRVWMATTMKSASERSPQKLTMKSFSTNMKTMFGMIFAGGIVTWIFITDGVQDIAFRLSGELQPIYLEQIGGITVEQIGLLGAIFSIAMMFTPIISGKMADKYGERVPIASGFILVFFAFMIFIQSNAFLGFAITWIVFGVGVGLLSPAYQSLMSKIVPQHMLGTFSGLFRGSLGLISLPAPWIGAQIWERFGPKVPFIITAIASVAMIIPIWFKFKVPDTPVEDESDQEKEPLPEIVLPATSDG